MAKQSDQSMGFDPSKPLENTRHELFAQGIVKGYSQAKSYEDAGYNLDEGNASRLTTHDKVQARIGWLKMAAAEKTIATVESLTSDLFQDREQCRDMADSAAGFRASSQITMDIAKLNGLVIDKSQLDAKVKSAHEVFVDVPEMSAEMRAALLKERE